MNAYRKKIDVNNGVPNWRDMMSKVETQKQQNRYSLPSAPNTNRGNFIKSKGGLGSQFLFYHVPQYPA